MIGGDPDRRHVFVTEEVDKSSMEIVFGNHGQDPDRARDLDFYFSTMS